MPNHHLNDTATESVSIYLRSDEAEVNLTTSHKKFYLSELISVNPDTNILVGLTDFECPYTFYTIRQGINDQITLGFNTALYPSGEYRTSFIPEGNYDIDDFLPTLNALTCFIDAGIVITFNDRTNKLTFTRAGTYNQFVFTATTTPTTELGLPKDLLITGGGTLNLTSPFIMPNCIDLGGSSCLYVKVNNLGVKNLNSKGDSDGTICKVQADVLPSEYIYYRPAEYFYFMTNKEQIREIDVEVLDDQYRPINLNGGIFSMTLSLHFAYKRFQRYSRGYYLTPPERDTPQTPTEDSEDTSQSPSDNIQTPTE